MCFKCFLPPHGNNVDLNNLKAYTNDAAPMMISAPNSVDNIGKEESPVGKGKIACNKQFFLFLQCFLPFGELSAIFIKFKIVCKLFQFGMF